jgi:hypothetical protein
LFSKATKAYNSEPDVEDNKKAAKKDDKKGAKGVKKEETIEDKGNFIIGRNSLGFGNETSSVKRKRYFCRKIGVTKIKDFGQSERNV